MNFIQERILLILLTLVCVYIGKIILVSKTANNTNHKYSVFIMILIFLIGYGVRLYGISFDIPWNYHHDERWKINVVKSMIERNSFNPLYFNHPSLLLYLTTFFYYLFGSFLGGLSIDDQIKISGRLVSIISGSVSVLLLIKLSRNYLTEFSSYICGFLFALFPLSVLASRYLKEDALLVCMMLIFFNCLLMKDSNKKFLIIGLTFGLCVGSKYTGAILGLFLLHFIPVYSHKRGILLLIGMMIGFIFTTPYSVLDFSSFIDGVLYEKRHMLIGNTIPISFSSQLGTYHLVRSILHETSLSFWILTAIGFGALCRDKKYLPCIAFLFFYLAAELVKAKIEPEPARYILPCIPFICIAFARFFDIDQKYSLLKVFAVFCLIKVLFTTYEQTKALSNDTRIEMQTFINENIENNKKILIDHRFNNPQFAESDPRISYLNVRPLTRGYPEIMNKEALTKMGIDYVLVSNLTYQCLYFCKEATPIENRSVMRLFNTFKVVHTAGSEGDSYAYHQPFLTLFSVNDLADEVQAKLELQNLNTQNPFMYKVW